MTKYKGLIVLEGCDGTGKTTLAKHLVEKYNGVYMHLGKLTPGHEWETQTIALKDAIEMSKTKLMVMDRHFISECIYGSVYRQGSAFPVACRSMYRAIRRARGMIVLCAPPVDWTVEHHTKLKETREEMYDSVRDVACRYLDLWQGNILRPRQGDLVEQWSAYGGVEGDSFMHFFRYDLSRDASRMERVAEMIVKVVDRDPDLGLDFSQDTNAVTGNIASGKRTFVLVGDEPNSSSPNEWPFYENRGSSLWLNESLHRLAVPEDELCIVNINQPGGREALSKIVEHPCRIVALGRKAYDGLIDAGFGPHAYVLHPQHARRFNHHDKQAYDKSLENALYGHAQA